MSKGIRILNDLYSIIQDDWAWRIKELDDFKTAVEKSKDEESRRAFIRAGITLLYAHWEGYVKFCSGCYYNYVTTKGYKLNELKENFVAISLRKELNELLISKKLKIQSQAINILINEFSKRASFPSEIPLRTSNMTYDIFEDYCILLNINPIDFELRKFFIDKKLVANRNSIAHGKYLSIQLNDFREIYADTIELMLKFKTKILNSASQNEYLKAS